MPVYRISGVPNVVQVRADKLEVLTSNIAAPLAVLSTRDTVTSTWAIVAIFAIHDTFAINEMTAEQLPSNR